MNCTGFDSNLSLTINVELLEERITSSTFAYSINFHETTWASSLNDVKILNFSIPSLHSFKKSSSSYHVVLGKEIDYFKEIQVCQPSAKILSSVMLRTS